MHVGEVLLRSASGSRWRTCSGRPGPGACRRGARWPEIGTTERTRSGWLTASSSATAAAHAVPDHVGPLDAEVIEQRRRRRSPGGRGDLPVDVGGAAVALQLDADHPVPARPASGSAPAKLRSMVMDTAVQQHQRRALAVHLVVHVQAVDVGVSARRVHPPQTALATGTHRSTGSRLNAMIWRCLSQAIRRFGCSTVLTSLIVGQTLPTLICGTRSPSCSVRTDPR